MLNVGAMKDWELVVACLSPTQAKIRISHAAQIQAREHCDGFGPRTEGDEVLFDWSHVRDSSEQAIAACAAYLRDYLDVDSLVKTANKALETGDTRNYVETLTVLRQLSQY